MWEMEVGEEEKELFGEAVSGGDHRQLSFIRIILRNHQVKKYRHMVEYLENFYQSHLVNFIPVWTWTELS